MPWWRRVGLSGVAHKRQVNVARICMTLRRWPRADKGVGNAEGPPTHFGIGGTVLWCAVMVAFAMRSATSLEVPALNPRAMVDFWESLYAGVGDPSLAWWWIRVET